MTDAAEPARAGCDADAVPCLAAVPGVRDDDVRVDPVDWTGEAEPECGVIRMAARVERHCRVARRLIGGVGFDRVLGPCLPAVERDVRARTNRLTDVPARIETELVVVRAAE